MKRRLKSPLTFSLYGIVFLLLACLAISVPLSYYLSKHLSIEVTNKVLSNELEIVLSALEAGPVAFARIQSSSIVNESLNRLFANGNLENRGFVSVEIKGGPNESYTFGRWGTSRKISQNCIVDTKREYHYMDSIHPIQIHIQQNQCIQLDEEKLIQNQSKAETTISILLTLLFIAAAIWPAANSLRLAEKYIKAGFEGDVNLIRFGSVRYLIVLARKSLEFQKIAILGDLSKQVAHDIRSPLSALNFVMASIKDLPEEKSSLIKAALKRINDIANELLKKSSQTTEELPKLETKQIAPLIDSIVREKRAQFADRTGIEFEIHTQGCADCYAKVNSIEFERVISNLINNSVEAISDSGKISVSIILKRKTIIISLTDDGQGIPVSVLKKLGEQGFSSRKSGSGLGLFHAKTVFETFGGSVEISSVVGKGTLVQLRVPQSKSEN